MNAIEIIKNYKNLLDEGIINQSDFEAKKNELLANGKDEGDQLALLKGYKELLDSNVISQEDFDRKKRSLLDQVTNTAGTPGAGTGTVNAFVQSTVPANAAASPYTQNPMPNTAMPYNKEALKFYQELYNQGIVTQEEYNAKWQELSGSQTDIATSDPSSNPECIPSSVDDASAPSRPFAPGGDSHPIQLENNTENKKKTSFFSKKSTKIVLAVSCLALILGVAFFSYILPQIILPKSVISKAEKLINEGEYEQAISVILDSGENLSDNEELNSLYVEAYEKWSEELVNSGEYQQAIDTIEKSGIELSSGLNISRLYVDAWEKLVNQKIENKDYYGAFDNLAQMIEEGIITKDEAREYYYSLGQEFENSKEYAAAGLSFAKAEGYKDADKKCKENWDKGAFRNTACIDDYVALGIRNDGTVTYAINTELIESTINDSSRHAREKTNVNTDGWSDIVSVCCNPYYYAGLTNDGSVEVGETGFVDFMIDGNLNSVGWEDIVSIDLEYGTLVGVDKNGKVFIAGDNQADYSDAKSWENIVQISLDYCFLTGVDIYGNVHIVNTKTNNSDYDSTDPKDCPVEESELQNKQIKQFVANSYYGVYITETGELQTTATAERAEKTWFEQPLGDKEQMDLKDYSGFDSSDFVCCDAYYDYYIGLRADGSVRVGGDMGYILENLGINDMSGLQEVHLGIGSNPVVYGVTKDGTFEMSGYGGGLYVPYQNRIKSWGKLRAPTIEYNTDSL